MNSGLAFFLVTLFAVIVALLLIFLINDKATVTFTPVVLGRTAKAFPAAASSTRKSADAAPIVDNEFDF